MATQPTTDPNRPVTGYPAPNGYTSNPPQSNTAYAYAAAQPPPPPHQSYYYQNQQQYPSYYQDPNSIRRANCLRRIFAAIIATVVIFGTITFIVWLVLRPQLPDFRVDNLTLSNFTLTNNTSLLSFTSDINLTARNPNKKMVLKYDRIEAEVFYKGWELADTALAPFEQGTRSEGPVVARFAAEGRFLERRAGDEIGEERGRSGGLVLNLRMVASVRFEARAWRARRRFLKVYCGDLDVGGLGGSNNNGTGEGRLRGGARQCRVGI